MTIIGKAVYMIILAQSDTLKQFIGAQEQSIFGNPLFLPLLCCLSCPQDPPKLQALLLQEGPSVMTLVLRCPDENIQRYSCSSLARGHQNQQTLDNLCVETYLQIVRCDERMTL